MSAADIDVAGLCVALATPFQPNGALDLTAFRGLVRHIVSGGAQAVIALGSTGEAATLDDAERDALIEASLAEAGGALVLVGTGSNDTRRAAALTRRARELGAHGALVVAPYYNKPMPHGVALHFAAIAEAAPDFPLIAYNVPSRTGTNITPALLATLWALPQVVAVKESSGNLAQIGDIAGALPRGKTLLAGDDNLALPTIALGGNGLVSVAANLVPGPMNELVTLAREGRFHEARALHQRLNPLFRALFCESNPIPLKAGLAHLGLGGDHLRLPLTTPERETRERVSRALELIG
ncbi:MAG: 4-hydroxy-tetrahydrodipicolinate synthase [Planctomycetota bacterium]